MRLHLRRIPILIAIVSGCASGPGKVRPELAPPALLGQFQDDYGDHFQITAHDWLQLPHSRLHIVAWHPAELYLIAQNDNASQYAPGKWTRIDWSPLSGMAPYTWGFCLTAYDAPSAAAAEGTPPANRAVPKTGCNGYPFTRMRPDTAG